MASTTANKKQIVDFLWEWTEDKSSWSKLLISKIVTNESNLQLSERKDVFNHFLESIELCKGLPVVTISKPSYSPTGKYVELSSLSEVKGVNRLAENQTINFGNNLTVIYGENGTGKTGYGRILKSLGFSYDKNEAVLSNIFKEAQPKSAIVKFKRDCD